MAEVKNCKYPKIENKNPNINNHHHQKVICQGVILGGVEAKWGGLVDRNKGRLEIKSPTKTFEINQIRE
jgi:hypothetical protein